MQVCVMWCWRALHYLYRYTIMSRMINMVINVSSIKPLSFHIIRWVEVKVESFTFYFTVHFYIPIIHYPFERSLLCWQRQHLFDQKYSKNHNIVKYYYNVEYIWNITDSCNVKAEFSAVFSFTWSFRDHSNMLICCLSKFIIINVENSCAT